MKRAIVSLLGAFLLAAAAQADDITVDSSRVLDGSNTTSEDRLLIVDGAAGPTVVTMASGADVQNALVFNTSTVNFEGGSTDGDTLSFDDSTVNLFSGTVLDDLRAFDNSVINVWGGTLGPGGILATQNAVINIHGGLLRSDFSAHDSAVINVYGRNLAFVQGGVAGMLEDGTEVFQMANQFDAGKIVLHNVPEPSSVWLLVFGAAGCAVVRRRRAA